MVEGLEKLDISEHTIICGWNKDAERILMEIVFINSLQFEKVKTLIETYKNIEIKFVYGDFTQESVLERANVREAKEIVILPDETSLTTPSDEKTLIATLNIKSINPKIKVYAYIIDRNNVSNLRVVIKEGEIGNEIFILLDGEVEVSKSLVMKLPGSEIGQMEKSLIKLSSENLPFFGEMALLDEKAERTATVTTLKPCKISFLDLAEQDKEIGYALFP